MVKQLSILGSTGSIGRQALQVVQSNPGIFQVVALTAGANAALLAEQARMFRPHVVAIEDATQFQAVKEALADLPIRVLAGPEGVLEAARTPAHTTLAAIVGMAGLGPALAAIDSTQCLAIANKESVVVGGNFLLARARERGVKIVPVDSEHNGLYQLLEGRDMATVSQAIITASGGPFRGKKREELLHVTRDQALKHPNWAMGAKNTIDSATLFNKGLELMEASILFDLPHQRLDAWVHPQSIVHALLQLTEGTLLMQASRPDMRVPIAHALCWPERRESGVQPLDCQAMKQLSFEDMDHKTFPAFSLARQCLDAGPWACLVYNTANEEAVQAFLDGRISFLSVMSIVQKVLETVSSGTWTGVDEAQAYGASVRRQARTAIEATC